MRERIQADYERLLAGLSAAKNINAQNLFKLLADNQDTEYGKQYGFGNIRTADEYRSAVPLCDYSDLCAMLDREARGERNVLTAYRIKCFLASSGTMGKQKVFPLTDEALARYSSYIYTVPRNLAGLYDGKHLHTSVFRAPNARGETLLSSAYYGFLAEDGALRKHEFVGGDLLFSNDAHDIPYVKLRAALPCSDLNSIQSIFLYDALLLFRYLEQNYALLLGDIENGTVSVPLPAGVKRKIENLPRPSLERLAELKKIFSDGFGDPIVPRVWKKLRYVSGIGGKAYARQTEALKRYTGNLPLYYFAYASSEVMAGVATAFDKAEYALLPDSAYYEFLPPGEEKETVEIGGLEIGKKYELVISTFSGLYRYKTGDIFKITGFRGETPLFEVDGRKNLLLDVAGEKTDAATLNEAVERLTENLRVEIREFSVGADTDYLPARYRFFIETAGGIDTNQAAEILDAELSALSADYSDVRRLGLVSLPVVTAVPEFYHDRTLHPEGKLSHKKPVTILSRSQYEAMASVDTGRDEE